MARIATAQKIKPCLWFNGNAEEAMNFYIGVFKNAKAGRILRYSDAGPGPKGAVLAVDFTLEGQEFMGLKAGPQHQFNPAISFLVACADQAEVDYYWDRLLAGGGKPVQCSWLTDKFGVSWQIAPTILLELLNDKDSAKAARVMQAMMKMVKIDIAAIERAALGD